MKKYLLLILIVILIGIVIPFKLHAADVTVGATTWYTWWDADGRTAGPAFLYGPALSANLNKDFNLTLVTLYGRFDHGFKRSDSDLALNYRLNNFFKFFAGIKYMSFWTSDMEHIAYGAGLGVSATLPIEVIIPEAKNLFLLANIGRFYLSGRDRHDGKAKQNTFDHGLNTALSIGCIIHSSTVISLGGRFQYIKLNQNMSDSVDMKFYGVTLTATYTFNI